ncbi:MAG TPA: sensor domain-containing diguanylate cyclase [Acidimicrobiales bacterium]|nr:sensor domain-containing diguanylate cyclase [Acidimicrobiales bacterium]
MLERSAVAAVVVDTGGVIRWHTASAARFLAGAAGTDLVGRALATLCDPDDAERVALYVRGVASLTADDHSVFVQVRAVHGDGTVLHLELTAVNLVADRRVRGIVMNVADVTARVESERQLTRLAREDPLTGLANRRVLAERLESEMNRLESFDSGHLGLLFVDLDRFKAINDAVGHAAGDDVLRQVAQRLATTIRPTDMAARFGGDEFAVMVGCRDDSDAVRVAERILASLQEPFDVAGTPVRISASIGIALSSSARSVERMLTHADTAMYRAKVDGRGRWCMFDPQLARWVMDQRRSRVELEGRAHELERKVQELQVEVETDPLTRLPNLRRQIDDLAEAERAAREGGVPFSVAFVDIDLFGQFNKSFGQTTGDEVLRAVGETLTASCRESDTVYRRGGEEFVVLFRNTALIDALEIAERMRRAVAGVAEGGGMIPGDVTVSIGVAEFDPSDHATSDAVIDAADAAMRVVKNGGRNQVRVAGHTVR